VKGDRPDSSQCQNLRGRLAVAGARYLVRCIAVGLMSLAEREVHAELLQVLMLIERVVVGAGVRAVEGSGRSEE
jgi:hypothetical protein